MNVEQYRASEAELQRTSDLLRLIPKDRSSVLDVGARDGHFSRLLTRYFSRVVALDLERPAFAYPGVEPAAGDITELEFEDHSFDCVFCAEVLEHVPDVQRAAAEIARVARHDVVVGVPYQQDTRIGRVTCRSCGRTGPPWGHVNRFDETRLRRLFARLEVREVSFVGTNKDFTNPISTWLMDLAGNPWGSYDQDERCVHCGARLIPPPANRAVASRIGSALAHRLNVFQSRFRQPHGNWIHVRFLKAAGQ